MLVKTNLQLFPWFTCKGTNSTRAVKTRKMEHCSRIHNKNFRCICGCSSVDDLVFYLVLKFKPHLYDAADAMKVLLHQEAFWIHTLQILVPLCLNQDLDFSIYF